MWLETGWPQRTGWNTYPWRVGEARSLVLPRRTRWEESDARQRALLQPVSSALDPGGNCKTTPVAPQSRAVRSGSLGAHKELAFLGIPKYSLEHQG